MVLEWWNFRRDLSTRIWGGNPHTPGHGALEETALNIAYNPKLIERDLPRLEARARDVRDRAIVVDRIADVQTLDQRLRNDPLRRGGAGAGGRALARAVQLRHAAVLLGQLRTGGRPTGQRAGRVQVGAVVDPDALVTAGVIKKRDRTRVKLLGEGELEHGLTVRVHAISESAKAKIEAKGGRVELLAGEKAQPQ